jgi:hypothetical protein
MREKATDMKFEDIDTLFEFMKWNEIVINKSDKKYIELKFNLSIF